jgi:ankyrin repeat protein
MVMDLYDAAKSGDVVELRRLVAAGADVEGQRGEHGWGPLHQAAYTGHMDVIRVLAELGADKDAMDAIGMTPCTVRQAWGTWRR